MGSPLSGRIAAKYPTSVFDLSTAAVDQHAARWGSEPIGSTERLLESVSSADVVLTCLPNTNLTRATLETLRPALREGTVWLDTTSGRSEDAAALAEELLEAHGIQYLDCAVSGGPRGAERGVLAALVGGDKATFDRTADVIGCFSDKITHLGPAGSGHLVKAINNALLAAHMLTASEAMATLARHGVHVPSALQAINGSSGRSWCTMQRFPDNVLTGDAYGFALGLHCKDMENAMRLIRAPHADGTPVTAPMLELARCLMNQVREELGGDVDHTSVTHLAERANRVAFDKCC